MNYDEYLQKGGTYEMPTEIFNDLLEQLSQLQQENQQLKKDSDYDFEEYKRLRNNLQQENKLLKEKIDNIKQVKITADSIIFPCEPAKLIIENANLKQEKEELIKDLKQFQSDWDKNDYVYKSIKLILSKLKDSDKSGM